MSAYLIVNIEITDPERYAEYVRVVPETIAKYGGKYLVRGGRAEKLEGVWEPKRVVILEFESLDRAKDWWSSEMYKYPKALRQASADADMIVVEGI